MRSTATPGPLLRRSFSIASDQAGGSSCWLEEYDPALESYRTLIASGVPQLAFRARRGIADVHFKRGNYSDAAAELRSAMQGGDRGAEAWFLLGRALEAQARELHASPSSGPEASRIDSEAAAALEQSGQLDSGQAQAHYLLAAVHRRQDRGDLARRDMESFLKARKSVPAVDPAAAAKAEQLFEARTAVQLAKALFAGNDAAGAERLLEHALNVQPGFNEALAHRAWILTRTGKPAEAARVYESLLAAEPDHAEALWNLGRLKLSAGQAQDAAPLLLRATEIRRAFPEGWALTQLAQDQISMPTGGGSLGTRSS